MSCYAVIDTNVFVAALLSKNEDSATVRVLDAVFSGRLIPLYHPDILAEYEEVLRRKKFRFPAELVQTVLEAIRQFGAEVFPKPTGVVLADMDDLIFYEVTMERQDDCAYLVTGNRKHYPVQRCIVTPAEMMEILDKAGIDPV